MIAAPELRPRNRRGGSVLKLHAEGEDVKFQTTPTDARNLEKPPNSSDWHANRYITRARSGVAAHLPYSNGRGGLRNSASRESHALTLAQVSNLIAAARYAALIGLPFTRMITIHWQAAGISLEGMAKATGRYVDYLTKALARHGAPTAVVWTHENCDTKDKGGHLHLLAHVPPDLVEIVTRLQKRWLRRITGRSYKAGYIYSAPIGGRLGLETGNPGLHLANLEVALSYLLKGAETLAHDRYAFAFKEPGGCVIGKRCGTSQNIGAKARLGQDERDGLSTDPVRHHAMQIGEPDQ